MEVARAVVVVRAVRAVPAAPVVPAVRAVGRADLVAVHHLGMFSPALPYDF